MKYVDLLRDDRWMEKRAYIINLDKGMCRDCFDSEITLQVHHIYYEYGKKPWEYDENALITLCCSCHEIEHERLKKLKDIEIDKELQKKGFRAKHFENLAWFNFTKYLKNAEIPYEKMVKDIARMIDDQNIIRRYDYEHRLHDLLDKY